MVEELGARLIRAGLATREQLADALADPEPVLAARLVDRGVDEEELVGYFLAQGYGPAASDSELADGAKNGHFLTPDIAHAMQAVALGIADEALDVAMSDPSDAHARRELERAAGRPIRARVAPVSRIREALQLVYPGTAPTFRSSSETPLALVRPKAIQTQALMEEALLLTRPKARPSQPELQLEQPTSDSGKSEPATQPVAKSRPEPPPSKSSKPPVPAKTFRKPVSQSSAPEARVRPTSIIPPSAASWSDLPASRAEPSKPSKSTPAEIGALVSSIRRSDDRDDIVRLGCEAAMTVGRCAVFLALRRGVLRGWEAKGSDVSSDAIRNLWIPATSPSMFRSVVEEREPYRGSYGTSAADNLFRAATGSRGGRIEVHAISVAGRTVAVLCVDEVEFGDAGSERLEHIGHLVGQALERVIAKR